VKGNQVSILRILLARGAAINPTGAYDQTLLHSAAMMDKDKALYLLVDHGANIEIGDSKGTTALHLAAQNLDQEVAAFLLDKGANVESRDYQGQTPLHVLFFRRVVKSCDDFLAVLRLLVERGADINARNTDGKTVLGILEGFTSFSRFKRRIEAELLVLGMNGIEEADDGSSDEQEVYWDAEKAKRGVATVSMRRRG
jgi:hypothetical protein